MGSLLTPGFVYWDGLKYTLVPASGVQGPAGPPGIPGPTGPQGPVGAPGTQGLGGIVENQGTPIPNNPHAILNFTGSGVVTSDAGAGVATVSISGTPVGLAGGDLSGNYPNPTVVTAGGGHTIITTATSAGGDLDGYYPSPNVVTAGGNTIITNATGAGGDLAGTYPNPTLAKIDGNPVLSQMLTSSQDGYVFTWHNAGPFWEALPLPSSNAPSGAAGGDLSGTYPNPTVATAGGHTIITNVANGAGGDLSGAYPNPTVAKIEGNPVLSQALGIGQDGYVMTWHNAGPYWEATLPAIVIPGLDTTAMTGGTGTFAYVSGNNTVSPTLATVSASSYTVGAYESVSGQIISSGVIPLAQFDTAGVASPGGLAYLSVTTAGFLTTVAPVTTGQFVAPVGIILEGANAGVPTSILLRIWQPVVHP